MVISMRGVKRISREEKMHRYPGALDFLSEVIIRRCGGHFHQG